MKGLFKIMYLACIALYSSVGGIYFTHALNTPDTGYKLVSGVGYLTIEAHGVCMQVRNTSGPDIFVPTKSSSEWSLFLGSYPSSEQTPCTHTWQTGGFGSCDATCGPGNEHQTVSCKRHNGDIVSDSWCSLSGPKPATTQSCNLGACILPVNGSCGSAGGLSFSSAPTSGLCATGNPTSVSGFGPWGWSCLGTGSGSDMGCSASVSSTTPGLCGTSNGANLASAPTGGLCDSGNSTPVTGSGPWNWNCNSIDGGSNMSCSANIGTMCYADGYNVGSYMSNSSSIPSTISAAAAQCCSNTVYDDYRIYDTWNPSLYQQYMRCGSSSVPLDCTAGTYYGYHVGIGSMNLNPLPHGSNQSVTKTTSGTPANGKTDYTATANCNNGSVTITGETTVVSCNSGYTWDGSSCVLIVAPKCYKVDITYNMTSDYIGPSWSYMGSKRCMSSDKNTMESITDCSTGTPKIPYSDGSFGSNKCAYTWGPWGDYWGHFSCLEVACP